MKNGIICVVYVDDNIFPEQIDRILRRSR